MYIRRDTISCCFPMRTAEPWPMFAAAVVSSKKFYWLRSIIKIAHSNNSGKFYISKRSHFQYSSHFMTSFDDRSCNIFQAINSSVLISSQLYQNDVVQGSPKQKIKIMYLRESETRVLKIA
jgi:hypothetical protein